MINLHKSCMIFMFSFPIWVPLSLFLLRNAEIAKIAFIFLIPTIPLAIVCILAIIYNNDD